MPYFAAPRSPLIPSLVVVQPTCQTPAWHSVPFYNNRQTKPVGRRQATKHFEYTVFIKNKKVVSDNTSMDSKMFMCDSWFLEN